MLAGLHRGWSRVRLVRGAALLLAVSLVSASLAKGQPQGGPLPPGVPDVRPEPTKQEPPRPEVPPFPPGNPLFPGGANGTATGLGPMGSLMPPSAVRFTFTIDPKTPLKELLPTPPQVKKPGKPVLTEDLQRVPEIDFQTPLARDLNNVEATRQTAHTIAKINFLNKKKTDAFLEALRKERTDLLGLPFAMGDECRIKGERSRQLTQAVRLVRQAFQGAVAVAMPMGFSGPGPGGPRRTGPGFGGGSGPGMPGVPGMAPRSLLWGLKGPSNLLPSGTISTRPASMRTRQRPRTDRKQLEHVTSARVAALMQVLLPESAALRLGLVKHLSATAHVDATKALARMALFSPEDEVRQAAVEALKVRRERDYTDILVSGLSYPLPAVARRASDAIVNLERSDLIPQLLDVLDRPDPRAPQVKEVDSKEVSVVRELVRINHHRNCLLCHAPGNTPGISNETLTAGVPVPSQPLPTPFEGGYRSSSPDILVRIDVTYLRQDFSLMQAVEDAAPWPEMQRFDFFVRTRVLAEEEARAHSELFRNSEPGRLSPYHRAALSALRELTGKDTEPTADAWRKLLGIPKAKKSGTF